MRSEQFDTKNGVSNHNGDSKSARNALQAEATELWKDAAKAARGSGVGLANLLDETQKLQKMSVIGDVLDYLDDHKQPQIKSDKDAHGKPTPLHPIKIYRDGSISIDGMNLRSATTRK